MNVCKWCGCVLFAGIKHARCETAAALAAPREPRRLDCTFWLGAEAELPRQPSRDLGDLTLSEAAIYWQAYAEGHAAARQEARESVSALEGYQGSADTTQAIQRPAGADCGASQERGDR
jgi:hypothetical protein